MDLDEFKDNPSWFFVLLIYNRSVIVINDVAPITTILQRRNVKINEKSKVFILFHLPDTNIKGKVNLIPTTERKVLLLYRQIYDYIHKK